MANITPRISKDGSIRWRVQVRLKEGDVRKTLSSKKEAERWAALTEEKLTLTRRISHDVNQIIALRQAGVYFLWKDRKVVYVGHSNNVLQRVMQHAEKKRDFNAWSVQSCAPEDMLRIERELIEKHKPALNVNGVVRRIVASGQPIRGNHGLQKPTNSRTNGEGLRCIHAEQLALDDI